MYRLSLAWLYIGDGRYFYVNYYLTKNQDVHD